MDRDFGELVVSNWQSDNKEDPLMFESIDADAYESEPGSEDHIDDQENPFTFERNEGNIDNYEDADPYEPEKDDFDDDMLEINRDDIDVGEDDDPYVPEKDVNDDDENNFSDNEQTDEAIKNCTAVINEKFIVDINFLLSQLKNVRHKPPKKMIGKHRKESTRYCPGTFLESDISSIVNNGVEAELRLKCQKCGSVTKIACTDLEEKPSLNESACLGAVLNGQGYWAHQDLFSTLGVRPIHKNKYYEIEKKVQNNMDVAYKAEQKYAIQKEREAASDCETFGEYITCQGSTDAA